MTILWKSDGLVDAKNKTPFKIYNHWSRFLSKTFTSAFLIVRFLHSIKQLGCGWYVDVTCRLVPGISYSLFDTSFSNYLP